jgi:CPA2 family monovalent cation:H+ antiporter-2
VTYRLMAVYGDANQREVLEQAGIAGATSLVLSASGSAEAAESIRMARETNPSIHIVARADYLRQTELLEVAGANELFAAEGEVALAMTDSILRHLGTNPEQLNKERERIRMELLHSAESGPPFNE